MICPVCLGSDTELSHLIEGKEYFKCNLCGVLFLSPKDRLDPYEEKDRYSQHKNDIYDPQYRKFLSALYRPLTQKLKPDMKGLDYGCGPGPALAEMFREDNYTIDIYDPYFFPDKSLLNKKYDFIACTEAAEHFYEPNKEFMRLDSLLEKGGWLGVMTNFYNDSIDFEDWYYRKDPTHVVFYTEQTLEAIALMMTWSIEIPANNIVLFKK